MKRGILALLLPLAVGFGCDKGLRLLVDPPGPWIAQVTTDSDTAKLTFHGVPQTEVPLKPQNRWLVLRANSAFYFADTATRQVSKKWKSEELPDRAGFDQDGRFVAVDVLINRPSRAEWIDPATGAVGGQPIQAWPSGPKGADSLKPFVSQDMSTIVTLTASTTRPLVVRAIDPSGNQLCELSFPSRLGYAFHPFDPVAAPAWALSRDGRLFALADAWKGSQRVSNRGVDVFDMRTGEVAYNIPIPDGPDSAKGAIALRFNHDDTQLYYRVARRIGDTNRGGWRMIDAAWFRRNLASGNNLPMDDFGRNEVSGKLSWSPDGRYVMWRDNPSGSPSIARLADERKKPQIIKRSLPEIDPQNLKNLALIPRQTAVAGVLLEAIDEKGQRIPFGRSVLDQMRLDQPEAGYDAQSVFHYDWQTGELTRLRTTSPDETITDLTTQPGRVAILIRSEKSGTTLEVYEVPLRSPAQWPTGIAVGVGILTILPLIRNRRKRVRLGSINHQQATSE